jgi:metallophosphoesterase (TIGR03767 family)
VSEGPAPLTTRRRLGAGQVLRTGSIAPYRAVQIIDGEPHLVRTDLVPAEVRLGGELRPLLTLVHLTDLQLADVQSPARFEFLNRQFADPRYAEIIPVQRPQEALTAHAVDTMLQTANAAIGPVTGVPPQLAITTGDAIDNAQWNEVQAFLALFDGGRVVMNSGGPAYQGVQSLDWPDDVFWKPDGIAASGPDLFRSAFGFPHWPGLLRRALADFTAPGLSMPWLSCFGNHEALNQGVGVISAKIAAALVSDLKPISLPADFDHDRALELFTHHPEVFLTGPATRVMADPARRAVTRSEFVAAHFQPTARPAGHGFTDRNRLEDTAYYVYDTAAIRLIALDTNCIAGGASGCLDHDQARWLAAQLAEVHSEHWDAVGNRVQTSNDDRLVVVFSHHGVDSLVHPLTRHAGPQGQPLLGGEDVLTLLHRFPNVVLWLNGHTHLNAVRARRDPRDSSRGLWEVTTSSIVDWPCQARLLEIVEAGGQLSIFSTMLDHDSPVGPATLADSRHLAALHRELAANMPFAGMESTRSGTHADRNVELRIDSPFPLARLTGG